MKTEIVKIKVYNHDIIYPDAYTGFSIYEVEISAEGRKNFRFENACEDGEWYTVSRWEREDGKIDKYTSILEEAKTNGLNDWLN
ncbi:hypothetical protein [Cupriavidus sp. H19C3]|uniref:hypothetical protein n=1 Tax=Cupriavidus sp. H19C3 TaxID=3241603 RepID=UPI003BF8938C